MNYKSRINIKLMGILVACFIFAAPVSAKEVNPGLWEISVTTSIAGMNSEMPVQKTQQCITSKDMVPRDMDKDGCKLRNVKVNNGKVSWEMSCLKQGMNITGKGNLNYSGSSMQGTSTLNLKQPNGQVIVMQQSYSGKRIGKCNK